MKKLLVLGLLVVSGSAFADIKSDKALADKKMAQCFKKASANAAGNVCLASGLKDYQKILAKNDVLQEKQPIYNKLMKDCEGLNPTEMPIEIANMYACQLGVTKYFLNPPSEGDILQYLSDGKYSTGW